MTDDPRHKLYKFMDMTPHVHCVRKPAKSRIEWFFWAGVVALLLIFANNI